MWPRLLTRPGETGSGSEITEILSQAGDDSITAFSGGYPHPATFPQAALQQSFGTVVSDPAALQYAPTGGLPGLRDWLADWLGAHDGLRPSDDELIITSGGMEGLKLITDSLVKPTDRVVLEGPSFMGAIMAIVRAGAQVTAIPMDEDGIDVDALGRTLATSGPAKFLYVIPDHQNPMGVTLSAARRHALIAMARRHGLPIVEDVAYRELSYDGTRLPSLRTLGPDVVIQLGTFSKTFSPGLRTGWIAAPAPLVAELGKAKPCTDQCTSALGQLLLEQYGRSGQFDAGIAASRAFYQRRQATMMRALEACLPDCVQFTRPTGGFFTWLTLPDEFDVIEVARLALAERITFVPGTIFYPDGRGRNELRLAFSRVDEDRIFDGVERLGRIFTQLDRKEGICAPSVTN